MTSIPVLEAKAYLQPLREGGSLPAVVETDDGLFVVKFRGAGQGPKALIAELISGLIAGHLGLPIPELAIIDLAPGFGAEQEDPEIRELVAASSGTNVGLRYLDGAFNYDARAAGDLIDSEMAGRTVWLDAYLTNPDRTARNPNMMVWDRRPWLIDHGSALYAHHAWPSVDETRTRTPFAPIRDHILLAQAENLADVDRRMAALLDAEVISSMMEEVPDALLADPLAIGDFASAAEARARYVRYLVERLAEPRAFVEEAFRAKQANLEMPKKPLQTRR